MKIKNLIDEKNYLCKNDNSYVLNHEFSVILDIHCDCFGGDKKQRPLRCRFGLPVF